MIKKLVLIAVILFKGLMTDAQEYRPILQLGEHNFNHLSEYFTYWLQPFNEPESVEKADSMFNSGAFVHWK